MGYFTFSVQPRRCSAGIAEGLRVFRMPCRWTFNMYIDVYVIHDHHHHRRHRHRHCQRRLHYHHHHHHHHHHDYFYYHRHPIPYEDKLFLFSVSANLPQGVEDV